MNNLDLSVMGSNSPMNQPKTTDVTFDNGDLVRVDEHGRWNLNDIHKHSGLPLTEKTVQKFTKRQDTQEYIRDLETEAISNNTANPFGLAVLESINGNGTYAHEELALEYARWISVPLRREVNQVFIKYQNGTLTTPINGQVIDPTNKYHQMAMQLMQEVNESKAWMAQSLMGVGHDIKSLNKKTDHLHLNKADKSQVDGLGRALTTLQMESGAQQRRNEVIDNEIEERITKEEADTRYVRVSQPLPEGYKTPNGICEEYFLTYNDDGKKVVKSKFQPQITSAIKSMLERLNVPYEERVNGWGKEHRYYHESAYQPIMDLLIAGMKYDRTTKNGNKIFINHEAEIEVTLCPDVNGGVALTNSTASPLESFFNK